MDRPGTNRRHWWMAIGFAVATGAILGVALRPYGPESTARADVISAMQIITLLGIASTFISRIPQLPIWKRWCLPLVATLTGLIVACQGFLPPVDVALLLVAGALWNVFLLGLSAATAGTRDDSGRVPVAALAVGVVLPFWPIAAAPLINLASGGVLGAMLNLIFSLCPSIWIIHITERTTGMNALVWFHSHLLYRVVPLGQNVLMPQAIPWYWVAGSLGLLGSGLQSLAQWRRSWHA
jgi:hypothetical protein